MDRIDIFFHDLYDHHWTLEQRRLTLAECAQIGDIDVDISFRHQFSFKD